MFQGIARAIMNCAHKLANYSTKLKKFQAPEASKKTHGVFKNKCVDARVQGLCPGPSLGSSVVGVVRAVSSGGCGSCESRPPQDDLRNLVEQLAWLQYGE
jgi:hypothetical protein